MACDFKITARQALRIQLKNDEIDKVQGDLWGVAA